MATICQLEVLPGAGRPLSLFDRASVAAFRRARWVRRNVVELVSAPAVSLDKLRRLLDGERILYGNRRARVQLGLQPGERVRVKTYDEILLTLDESGRHRGLAFMRMMRGYCGGTFTVRKRVARFFDERTGRMLELRDVVILDEVLCAPPLDGGQQYAGCDRSCFFFWKEAWLERAPEPS